MWTLIRFKGLLKTVIYSLVFKIFKYSPSVPGERTSPLPGPGSGKCETPLCKDKTTPTLSIDRASPFYPALSINNAWGAPMCLAHRAWLPGINLSPKRVLAPTYNSLARLYKKYFSICSLNKLKKWLPIQQKDLLSPIQGWQIKGAKLLMRQPWGSWLVYHYLMLTKSS